MNKMLRHTISNKSEGSVDEHGFSRKVLEELSACQEEIDFLNDCANNDIVETEKVYINLRRKWYVKRSKVMEDTPSFWTTAFLNHPLLSNFFKDDDDMDCLTYIRSFDITDFDDITTGYRISFQFMENPYFENELLIKEFHWSSVEGESSEGSKIHWREGYEQLRRIKKSVHESLGREHNSFLDWFSDHKDPANDNIALALKELWTFPKLFYTLRKKTPKYRESKTSRYQPQSLKQNPETGHDLERDESSTENDSIAKISETSSNDRESIVEGAELA